MIPLLQAAEMTALDRWTVDEVGLPGAVLMETAGRGVYQHLLRRFRGRIRPDAPCVVVCGRGNNGGDGFVVARCLANAGIPVQTVVLGRCDGVSPGSEAALHLRALRNSGGSPLETGGEFPAEVQAAIRGAGVIVDALFGTGLSKPISGVAGQLIAAVNEAPAAVVSVDLPSGVCADNGDVLGSAVRADLTVTFAWPKRGHYLGDGRGLCGELEVVEIGIPPGLLPRVAPSLYLAESEDFSRSFHRGREDHKGIFGHLLVIGGSAGMAGAPALAALGALRSGVGRVTVAWPGAAAVPALLPLEAMSSPLLAPGGAPAADWHEVALDALARTADPCQAVVVGPGLGSSPGLTAVLERLVGCEGPPLVVDADALNALARNPLPWEARRRPLILTPHPGEAGRLLGSSAAAVQRDRLGALASLVDRFRCTVVLKGAGTLVQGEDEPAVLIPAGNPGMATAGMGDVLAGVIGAFAARGMSACEAARAGAFVHACAGDLAAGRGGLEGLVAGDVAAALPQVLRDLGEGQLSGQPLGAPCGAANMERR